MQISSAVSSCTSSRPAVDQDLQVKGLRSKIDDWSTCPTTDPQTKKEIVGRLQVQLDELKSSLENHAKAKESQAVNDAQGLGATVDIQA